MNAKQYRIERDHAIEQAARLAAQLASVLPEKELLVNENIRLTRIVESEDRLNLVEENEKLRRQHDADQEAIALLMEAKNSAEEILAQRQTINRPRRPEPETVEVKVVDDSSGLSLMQLPDGRTIPVKVGDGWVMYKDSGRNMFQLGKGGSAHLPINSLDHIVEAVAVSS